MCDRPSSLGTTGGREKDKIKNEPVGISRTNCNEYSNSSRRWLIINDTSRAFIHNRLPCKWNRQKKSEPRQISSTLYHNLNVLVDRTGPHTQTEKEKAAQHQNKISSRFFTEADQISIPPFWLLIEFGVKLVGYQPLPYTACADIHIQFIIVDSFHIDIIFFLLDILSGKKSL